ncbi:cytochrome c biogenesis protein DipZ [Methylocapsa aurea]|uniref:cytochrome c biogenesis protein DipZ n=1 Tax=Methylocapsa aurea TaxID=663610 RepID=UPI000A05F1D7|nr:cytochrome c biogenesis protein DipZ [Methylocapsa aurea]
MTLLILAYLAGIITIFSPCILPVLPFVFSRADQPFMRSGLPLLLGMAAAFTGVATLAAVGGGWAVETSQYGRLVALGLLALFAATLLSNRLAQCLARPLAALGQRLSLTRTVTGGGAGPLPSVVLGIATGLLWAPCAGPILGVILTGAALSGASIETSLFLLAYAFGAATSLALALLAGGQLLSALKRSLGAEAWLRRGFGASVLAGVAMIAAGWDTQLLSQVTFPSTTPIEERLIDWSGGRRAAASKNTPIEDATSVTAGALDRQSWVSPAAQRANALPLIDVVFKESRMAPEGASPIGKVAATKADLPVEGALPGFVGAIEWLNSAPLTPQALRGKVVLVNFWTFNCFNCLNALPYVRAWAEKYRDHGLVVVGVHTPELAFERDIGNVRKAVARLKIDYPVAVDNAYAIWKAFDNQYWPAAYFVDAEGRIRHHHFGEHDYANSERFIQQLLEEAGYRNVPGGFVTASSAVPLKAFAVRSEPAGLASRNW